MSNFAWMIVIVLALTALGSLALGIFTIKYYWARGKPPATGEERRRQKEEELRLRAKQIEHSKKNPREPRNPSFWNNRKISSKK